MNISDAARQSGVPAKTIRYYESIGLIPEPARTSSGYRQYTAQDVQVLSFAGRARALGFSVEEVAALLALWRDKGRASGDVKRLAEAHIAEIERKIADLERMRATLRHLVGRCQGDDRPECPILDELAGETKAEDELSKSDMTPV